MISRGRLARVPAVLLAAVSCTPLGLWLYEDPSVYVARVRLDQLGQAAEPVVVALDLRNPNDYTIDAKHLELSLLLDDQFIGRLARDSTVPMPKGTTASLAVPLTARNASRAKLRSFASGVHRFSVRGRATFRTPIGDRKVRFLQDGELAFGPAPLVASDSAHAP